MREDALLGAAADELYALPAGEFTAARNARAKAAKATGDRDLAARIAALPRPSTAAWAVNQLARRAGADLDRLLELGARLRAAHAELDGEAIRALGQERHQQVAALARQVRALAEGSGQSVSDAVEREIEATFAAAVTTEEAGAAVRSGRLTKALFYAGFGEVELDGAVAVPRRLAAVPDAPPPADPEPGDPEPAEPDPAEPEPAEPDPAEPDPAEPDPAEPDPAVERRRRIEAEGRERELIRARTAAVDADRRLAELRTAQEELRTQLARAGQRVETAAAQAHRAADRLRELEG